VISNIYGNQCPQKRREYFETRLKTKIFKKYLFNVRRQRDIDKLSSVASFENWQLSFAPGITPFSENLNLDLQK
jgi:hypothetical protein